MKDGIGVVLIWFVSFGLLGVATAAPSGDALYRFAPIPGWIKPAGAV